MKSQIIIDKIQAKLDAVDPEKRTVKLVFQLNYTNTDGDVLKSVVLDLKEGKIYEGTYENPDGEVTIADEDFFAVATKEISVLDLIASGKVKVTGHIEVLKKLMDKLHQ